MPIVVLGIPFRNPVSCHVDLHFGIYSCAVDSEHDTAVVLIVVTAGLFGLQPGALDFEVHVQGDGHDDVGGFGALFIFGEDVSSDVDIALVDANDFCFGFVLACDFFSPCQVDVLQGEEGCRHFRHEGIYPI